MQSAKNRTVLITGASSGIGLSLSKLLITEGAEVIGITRRPDALASGVRPFQLDLRDPSAIASGFRAIKQLDALVNSAGVAYTSRISDGDPAEWDEMWQINVRALALCCQLALPLFPETGGRIVNVSSMSGNRVPGSGGFYSPTKFAVRAITDALRAELSAAGSTVQVSSVSPGYVDTPILDRYFRGRGEALAQTRSSKILQPEDVADVIGSILSAPAHVAFGDVSLRGSGQLS